MIKQTDTKQAISDFFKALYEYVVCVDFRILTWFMSSRLRSKLIIRELERLCKLEDNSLSETSVAIIASGLGVPTTAKRKRVATKKKEVPQKAPKKKVAKKKAVKKKAKKKGK